MTWVNVLILIHGMTLETIASSHRPAYDVLWHGLTARAPQLNQAINAVIRVEWGHEVVGPHPAGLADDEYLTGAENTIQRAISYAQVRADPGPDNHLRTTPPWNLLAHAARRITEPIKEIVLPLSFTDAIFYCSPEGEQAIRKAVYSRVLKELEPFRGAAEVRLHVIAGSLGATVAFDFLYGLNAPRATTPDFVAQRQGDAVALAQFTFWRQRAQLPVPTLVLGSKTTTGAQIPLMMMRSQAVVQQLAQGQHLDPRVIGVPQSGLPKWRIFYDVDDILGFPTRRLFAAQGTIQDIEVDTGLYPTDAHGKYWTHPEVLNSVAQLITKNV